MDEALKAVRPRVMGLSRASKEFCIPRNTITYSYYDRIKDPCELIGRKTITDQEEINLKSISSFNPFPTAGTLKYRSINVLLIKFDSDLYKILVKSFFIIFD